NNGRLIERELNVREFFQRFLECLFSARRHWFPGCCRQSLAAQSSEERMAAFTQGSSSVLRKGVYDVPIKDSVKKPRCIAIAGPNGAGKTTFAREFLPREAGVIHFVNVDLIAGGLSPLAPKLAEVTAGKLLLKELKRLAHAREDFAFESTLSSLAYANRIKEWKAAGYRIEICFVRLSSPSLALRRIAARVKQGGHDVARSDVLR